MSKCIYKHINVLGRLLGLVKFFGAENFLNVENRSKGTGEECVAMETRFYYICRCATFKTISVASFNDLCSKLTGLALFIYSMSI